MLMLTKNGIECPICYTEMEGYTVSEHDPPYYESSHACPNGCFFEESWCGSGRITIIIRGHCIELYSLAKKQNWDAYIIITTAARRALIEDLLQGKKPKDWKPCTTGN